MSYLKILPLPPMFDNMEWEYGSKESVIQELTKQGLERVTPVYGRDGWYYRRLIDLCWYEWQGTAWLSDMYLFRYAVRNPDVIFMTYSR